MDRFIKLHVDNGDVDYINTRYITRIATWEDRKGSHIRVFFSDDSDGHVPMDVLDSVEDIEKMIFEE